MNLQTLLKTTGATILTIVALCGLSFAIVFGLILMLNNVNELWHRIHIYFQTFIILVVFSISPISFIIALLFSQRRMQPDKIKSSIQSGMLVGSVISLIITFISAIIFSAYYWYFYAIAFSY